MVPPSPWRFHHVPSPSSWSYASHNACAVPAATKGPPSGQLSRITGAVHVDRSVRPTPRVARSIHNTSWQPLITSVGIAPRTATYPSLMNRPMSAAVSTLSFYPPVLRWFSARPGRGHSKDTSVPPIDSVAYAVFRSRPPKHTLVTIMSGSVY